MLDISKLKGIVAEEIGRGRFANDEYKSAEKNIIDSLGRLRSGGAITEDELKTFTDLMPRWWNTDEESISRLERLENIFNGVVSGVSGTSATETKTQQQYDFDSQEGIDDFLDSFSSDLSRSLNGSGAQQVLSLGSVTGFGSPYWQYGLDIDLRKGDPVANVEPGRVIYAGNNGGFGNQVQVLTPSGDVYWYSHLDKIGVQAGDTIRAGQAGYAAEEVDNLFPSVNDISDWSGLRHVMRGQGVDLKANAERQSLSATFTYNTFDIDGDTTRDDYYFVFRVVGVPSTLTGSQIEVRPGGIERQTY